MVKSFSLIMMTMTPALALASGAAGGNHDPLAALLSADMAYKGINFLILLILLHIFIKKPLTNVLRASATATRDEMELTQKHVERKELELEELQKKFQAMEADLKIRRTDSLNSIELEKEKIIADAKAQATRIEEATEKRITQNLNRAKNELRNYLINEASQLAEKELQTKIGDTESKSLMKNFEDNIQA